MVNVFTTEDEVQAMNVLMCKYDQVSVEAVLERADDVYLVLDDFDANRDLPEETLSRFKRHYRVSSFDSLEELSAVVADLEITGARIDKVASFTEFSQYAAGYLAHLLGLDHNNTALKLAANTRDKRLMKRVAQEAGLTIPRFYSLPDGGKTLISTRLRWRLAIRSS